MDRALSHIKVIDLTHFVAGPYCTKLLAGFGAQVIKIEPPKTGDKLRNRGPFFRNREDLDSSIPFLWLNTGKKGVTLNLKTEKGVEILKALIRQSDVLVENFSPRVMPGLGLSYDTVREINPKLTMVSISNFGQSGPYRDYKAEEIELEAMSGLMHLSGDPENAPLAAGPAVCQYIAGLHAYLAISMALFQRLANGKGLHVDISIMESALENIESQLSNHLHTGANPSRGAHMGVPWDLYPCEDGYASIISMPARHWHRAAEILDDPELFHERYDHIRDRIRDRHHYEACLKRCLKTKKKVPLFHAGQSRHLAFGYLAALGDVLASPQHEERGFLVELDHPATGKHKYCDAPFKMSKNKWKSSRAPLLGEHNRWVYGQMLGYSEEELEHLEKEGVI